MRRWFLDGLRQAFGPKGLLVFALQTAAHLGVATIFAAVLGLTLSRSVGYVIALGIGVLLLLIATTGLWRNRGLLRYTVPQPATPLSRAEAPPPAPKSQSPTIERPTASPPSALEWLPAPRSDSGLRQALENFWASGSTLRGQVPLMPLADPFLGTVGPTELDIHNWVKQVESVLKRKPLLRDYFNRPASAMDVLASGMFSSPMRREMDHRLKLLSEIINELGERP